MLSNTDLNLPIPNFDKEHNRTYHYLYTIWKYRIKSDISRKLTQLQIEQKQNFQVYIGDKKNPNFDINEQILHIKFNKDKDFKNTLKLFEKFECYLNHYSVSKTEVMFQFKYIGAGQWTHFITGNFSKIYSKGEPDYFGKYPNYLLDNEYYIALFKFAWNGFDILRREYHVLKQSDELIRQMSDDFNCPIEQFKGKELDSLDLEKEIFNN